MAGMAASPGFAPGPLVSEASTLLLRHEAIVAREGTAPSISGCRPDVMLFHHRAEIGCLAWICTRTVGVKTRYATITPRGNDWLAEREL